MSAMGVIVKSTVYILHLHFFVLVIYWCTWDHSPKQSFSHWLKTTVLYFPNEPAIWVELRGDSSYLIHSISWTAHLRLEDPPVRCRTHTLVGWSCGLAGCSVRAVSLFLSTWALLKGCLDFLTVWWLDPKRWKVGAASVLTPGSWNGLNIPSAICYWPK